MSIKIAQTIIEALESEAEKKGVTPEELLLDLLLGVVPEEDKPKAVLETVEDILSKADKYASDGNYKEAFKRLWSCTSLAFRAYALKTGKPKPEKLEDYWGLAAELGGAAFYALYSGIAAEAAAAKGLSDGGHYKAMRSAIEKLIEQVKAS